MNKLHQDTPKCANDKDGEINASDTDDHENEIQDNPFRPTGTNQLRTQVQPISIQYLDLDNTVIVNEDRTGEGFHTIGFVAAAVRGYGKIC